MDVSEHELQNTTQLPAAISPFAGVRPPRTPPPVRSGHLPLPPPSPKKVARIAADEQRGAEVVAAVYARGDLPDPTIDDDDWEDVPDSDLSSESSDDSDLEDVMRPDPPDPFPRPPAPSPSPPPAPQPAVANMPAQPDPLLQDPFYRPDYSPSEIPSSQDVHPHPAAYLVYVTVLWLHTQCKLPFRACNALLIIFSTVLSIANVALDPPLCTTLPTVMTQLRSDANFQELPVCHKCLKPYPTTTPPDALCSVCSQPLYNTRPTVVQQNRGRTMRAQPKPYLRCPYKSLDEQLTELIPEIEHLVDNWRTKERVPGVYTDHFDGEVCQELEGADGLPFFRPDLKEMPDGELRLGVTLGVDWFSYRRSLISASHSSCPMSFSIINLPPSLR